MQRWRALNNKSINRSKTVKSFQIRKGFRVFTTTIFMSVYRFLLSASGLFVASKFPVLDTEVGFFAPVAFYQKIFAHAYLLVKLDLGIFGENSADEKKLVGYLATTHLPAYENEKTSTSRHCRPLSKLHEDFNAFQCRTLRKDENVAFAVVLGDFNLCNICKCKFQLESKLY